jgi:DNA-binding IscR family transcriptional regulator
MNLSQKILSELSSTTFICSIRELAKSFEASPSHTRRVVLQLQAAGKIYIKSAGSGEYFFRAY